VARPVAGHRSNSGSPGFRFGLDFSGTGRLGARGGRTPSAHRRFDRRETDLCNPRGPREVHIVNSGADCGCMLRTADGRIELETGRLLIRGLREDDIPALIEYLSAADPMVRRVMGIKPTRDAITAYWGRCANLIHSATPSGFLCSSSSGRKGRLSAMSTTASRRSLGHTSWDRSGGLSLRRIGVKAWLRGGSPCPPLVPVRAS
jgi:hypothetical protein